MKTVLPDDKTRARSSLGFIASFLIGVDVLPSAYIYSFAVFMGLLTFPLGMIFASDFLQSVMTGQSSEDPILNGCRVHMVFVYLYIMTQLLLNFKNGRV